MTVGRSEAELEVKVATSLAGSELSGVHWVHRMFTDAPANQDQEPAGYSAGVTTGEHDGARLHAFFDSVLSNSENRVLELQRWMTTYFIGNNLKTELTMAFSDYSRHLGDFFETYEKSFVRGVEAALRCSLESARVLHRRWDEDGLGVGVPGVVLGEMLLHSARARQLCEDFVGQDRLLAQAKHVLQGPSVEGEQWVFSG